MEKAFVFTRGSGGRRWRETVERREGARVLATPIARPRRRIERAARDSRSHGGVLSAQREIAVAAEAY